MKGKTLRWAIMDSKGECGRKGLGVECPASCKGGCIECKYAARYNVNSSKWVLTCEQENVLNISSVRYLKYQIWSGKYIKCQMS